MEKALADALENGGYQVLNKVNCRMSLDPDLWEKVHRKFAREFERIGLVDKHGCIDGWQGIMGW